jgi:para-aminobenzoate synthetase component 1
VLIAVDAMTGASWPCQGASKEEWQRLRAEVEATGRGDAESNLNEVNGEPALEPMVTPAPAGYMTAVERTREYIRAGDIFQANITWPFAVETCRSAEKIYRAMRALTPATHAAFLRLMEGGVVMSASPEVYLRGAGGRFETRPIKGTVRLSGDAGAMRAALGELHASVKDCAEHVMIVDVKRNDLGRLARVGRVRVSRLLRPLALRNLVHLESTVEAELRAEVSAVEALAALFPGGSISGAPKIRACQVIRELEPCRRRVYTGCIGWIGRQSAHLNIGIRTVYSQTPEAGVYHYHAGGGITADSDTHAEWRECLLKAERLRLALGGEVKVG